MTRIVRQIGKWKTSFKIYRNGKLITSKRVPKHEKEIVQKNKTKLYSEKNKLKQQFEVTLFLQASIHRQSHMGKILSETIIGRYWRKLSFIFILKLLSPYLVRVNQFCFAFLYQMVLNAQAFRKCIKKISAIIIVLV